MAKNLRGSKASFLDASSQAAATERTAKRQKVLWGSKGSFLDASSQAAVTERTAKWQKYLLGSKASLLTPAAERPLPNGPPNGNKIFGEVKQVF